MKGRSARQKGKMLEDHVADRIVALGLDPKARRDGGSGNGNREKGDIITSLMVLGQNVGIECKNQATIAIPDWWRQARKLEVLGREPVLAFKIPLTSYDDTLVTIYLETFLELVKRANAVDHVAIPAISDDREKTYALEELRKAINRAMKVL